METETVTTPANTAKADRKAQNAGKILAAAKELFDAHGFEDVTVRQIAKHAGLNTIHVYNNWPSVADLYADVYGHRPITQAEARELLRFAKRVGKYDAEFDNARALLAQILPDEYVSQPDEPMSAEERRYDAECQAADEHRKLA